MGLVRGISSTTGGGVVLTNVITDDYKRHIRSSVRSGCVGIASTGVLAEAKTVFPAALQFIAEQSGTPIWLTFSATTVGR